MTTKHITDATMRVRDCLYDSLRRWEGQVVTEDFARAWANNMSTAAIEVLRQMADEAKATDEPPPVRVTVDRLCRLERWCELAEGHAGSCLPPPF